MKIKFLIRREVKDGSGTVFEAGKVYDLPDDSANHWLSRGVAEIHTAAPEKAEAEPASKAETEKPKPRGKKPAK